MNKFFADLGTKIKADLANAFAIISTGMGSALAHIEDIAATLGDPNLKEQLSTVVGDAKWIGRWMLFVGVVTAIARFKKLVESPKS